MRHPQGAIASDVHTKFCVSVWSTTMLGPKGDAETTPSERLSIRIRVFSSSKAEMSQFELATISYTDLTVWCNDYVKLHLHFRKCRDSFWTRTGFLIGYFCRLGRTSVLSLTEFWSQNSACGTRTFLKRQRLRNGSRVPCMYDVNAGDAAPVCMHHDDLRYCLYLLVVKMWYQIHIYHVLIDMIIFLRPALCSCARTFSTFASL